MDSYSRLKKQFSVTTNDIWKDSYDYSSLPDAYQIIPSLQM